MDFQDYEHLPPLTRSQQTIATGQVYRRIYRVPIKAADSLLPARGEQVALRDVEPTSGALAPRVLSVVQRRSLRDKSDMIEVEIAFYKVEPEDGG